MADQTHDLSLQIPSCCTPADSPQARDVHTIVRESYGQIATRKAAGCCGLAGAHAQSARLGYEAEALRAVPEGADMGLGCGNPTAIAHLRPGEVVLDLGAGGGLDAFLAAERVGPEGRVIGVDMTPEMLERARENAAKSRWSRTVEFREGMIENLPVVSGSVDVILSNCVINLSPDKPQVFREAFRVLKSGGRIAVSDILLTAPLPPELQEIGAALVACISGAALVDEYLGAIEDAGFVDIRTERRNARAMFEGFLEDPIARDVMGAMDRTRLDAALDSVFSYTIEATKP